MKRTLQRSSVEIDRPEGSLESSLMPRNDLLISSQLTTKANDHEPSTSLADAGNEAFKSVVCELLQAETLRG